MKGSLSGVDMINSSASNLEPVNNKLESKTSLKSRVSSILSSCRICLSSIINAATLTCGHRYCERCLDQYWRVGEKPDCIVCPLCRSCAFNVNFSKTDRTPSTEDFRTVFSQDLAIEAVRIRSILWIVKVTAIMPVLFYLLNWINPYIIDLCTQLYLKFASLLAM